MQMSFPETVSDRLCRNSFVMQTDCCSSCPGGWSQMILEVKVLDVECQERRQDLDAGTAEEKCSLTQI